MRFLSTIFITFFLFSFSALYPQKKGNKVSLSINSFFIFNLEDLSFSPPRNRGKSVNFSIYSFYGKYRTSKCSIGIGNLAEPHGDAGGFLAGLSSNISISYGYHVKKSFYFVGARTDYALISSVTSFTIPFEYSYQVFGGFFIDVILGPELWSHYHYTSEVGYYSCSEWKWGSRMLTNFGIHYIFRSKKS